MPGLQVEWDRPSGRLVSDVVVAMPGLQVEWDFLRGIRYALPVVAMPGLQVFTFPSLQVYVKIYDRRYR